MTTPPPPPPGNYPPPPPPPPSGEPHPAGGYAPPPPPPPPGGGYPPPPGGGYPPPPAPQGGYAPPPPVAAGGGLPTEAYTAFGPRLIAWLIDWLPVLILTVLGPVFLVSFQTVETVCVDDTSGYDLGQFCATGNNGPSTVGWILGIVLPILGLAYLVWNLGYKQGTTGSSIGKGMQKFKIVSEDTGQPVGFGMSLVRALIYVVLYGVCGIAWLVAVLFPLWDPKRQSLVDKILKTVALPV